MIVVMTVFLFIVRSAVGIFIVEKSENLECCLTAGPKSDKLHSAIHGSAIDSAVKDDTADRCIPVPDASGTPDYYSFSGTDSIIFMKCTVREMDRL